MLSLLFGAGLAWMAVGFLGLPLGVPPESEEPIMAYAAPEDCVLYVTWSAMATPSAASGNQTEQVLAEPEVKKFLTVLERTTMTAALAAAKNSGIPPQQADEMARTGELWIRTVLTQSGAFYVSRLEPRGEEVDLQAAVIIKAGEAAVELDRSFTMLLSQGKEKPTETTVAGRPFRKLALPNEKLEVVWGANNGYMMIGLGDRALDDLSSRIRARKEPNWLTQIKSDLPVDRRSSITYVNIRKLVDTFAPRGGPEAQAVVNALGLQQLDSFQAVTGLDSSGMLSRTLLAIDGTPRGVWTLLDEKGLGAADLKHIPADSLAAGALAFDARKAYDTVLATIAEIEPQAAEQIKQQLQHVSAQLGISVPDALAALGTKWSFYSAHGAGGMPAMAIVVDVRDKQRLVDLEQRLRSMLLGPGGEIPNVGRITKTQIGGQPAATITLQAPQMAAVSPTWCITDKQLIIATSPQAVQAVMTGQAKSLADNPEVSAGLSGTSGPLMLSYFDTPRSFAAGYGQVQMLLPMFKAMAQQAQIPLELEASDFPAPRTIVQHLQPSVMTVRRTAKGLEGESRRTIPGPSVGASTGVLVALLLPAVQAAREAARRMQSSNHIKQQLLGLHNFHDLNRAFPPGYTVSRDGKPLLSWRVAILPYIEQKELYNQFRHDEPWDSEHNKQLLEKMPAVFRSPNSRAKAGMTVYLGVGGPQGVLGQPKAGDSSKGTSFADMKDGTSNTVAIVETSDELAVEWTKPVDWVPNAADPYKGVLGMRPNGFLAGFADGHTSFISKDLDPKSLGYLFSHSDGNAVELPPDRPPPARPGPGIRAVPPPANIPAAPRSKAPPPRPAAKANAG